MAAALSAGFCRYSSLDLQAFSKATGGRGLKCVWRSRLNDDFRVTYSCADTSTSAGRSRFELTNDDQWQRNVQYGRYTELE